MTRRLAKKMRRCGGVRLTNRAKEAAKLFGYGSSNSTIMEYRRAVSLGRVPGHSCWRG